MNEIKAYIAYSNRGGDLSFWRTPHGTEIDLIYESAQDKTQRIGFEFKTSTRWKNEYCSALKDLLESETLTQGFGVYLGENSQKDGKITILNVQTFLERLWNGEII